MEDLSNHPRSTGRTVKLSKVFNVLPQGGTIRTQRKLGAGERGAIVADDWGLRGSGTDIHIHGLDTHDPTYRLAFLFNDQLTIPEVASIDRFGDSGPPDFPMVRRTELIPTARWTYEEIAKAELETFRLLEQHEPGAWSLWHEPDFDPVPPQYRQPDLALRMTLHEALIVPCAEVPFQDVIEFRERNLKQLRSLRQHTDGLALQIAATGPDPALLRLEKEKLQDAIAAYTEDARKHNWRKSLFGLSLSCNMSDIAAKAIIGGAGSAAIDLPLPQAVAAIGLAALPSISLAPVRGIRGYQGTTPFEYLARIERDLI